jgi:hypothetical protein
VTGVSELAERRQDIVPTTLILESATHGLGDECAALPTAQTPVELRNETRVQRYV